MVDNYLDEMMKKLLDQSEETQKTVISFDKKLDLHIQKTELQLEQIHKLDEKQNAILEEHHKRSDALARDNELRERSVREEARGLASAARDEAKGLASAVRDEAKILANQLETRLEEKAPKRDLDILATRLDKIEKPTETVRSLIKSVVYLGTIAGSLYGIYQFVQLYIK